MSSLGNIVLDSKGYPHLIYAEGTAVNDTIEYASWSGTAWNIQSVASNVSVGGTDARDGFFTMGCLSLDSHNAPHIAYVTSSPDGTYNWGYLAYATWTGETWDVQSVNSTVVAQSCDLTVDSNGYPHISLVGVVQGSEAEKLTGAYSYTAPVMYATTVERAKASSLTSTELTLLTILTVIIVAVIFVLVYVLRKITQKPIS